jgi:hypothetical protein
MKESVLKSIDFNARFIEKGEPTKPINEYDILDQRHTLMHTLTALSKLTQLPVTSFQNPQQETGPTAS